jgi:uncharacterized protein (TIGR02996 family)
MTDGDALLRAIIAHPDGDVPRLVYADWLEENGDPARAQFIRVQCEIARYPEFDAPQDLVEREWDLLDEWASGGCWNSDSSGATTAPLPGSSFPRPNPGGGLAVVATR